MFAITSFVTIVRSPASAAAWTSSADPSSVGEPDHVTSWIRQAGL